MAGRIPQQFVQDLLSRVDIVDVVQSRVPLKKKGKDYWACCPFHGEKSPSFSVSQSKQFYKCFGCGVAGNALGFVMAYDRIEFPSAVELLAERLGIEVPREEGSDPQAGLRQELYAILSEASTHYQRKLRETDGIAGVEYLKRRGVSGEIAKHYGIGYSPPGWDGLLKAVGTSPRLRELLEQAGMLIPKDGGGPEQRGHYDRFRERVMFPIRDARGRVIGFGGRVLDQGEPKYLNSPETPVFHKGSELYGLFEAKQHKDSQSRMVLVEGYMDVVALAQFGIPNAVAALGTAATAAHLETLFRYCPEVVCCFDGDKAGRGAAWRALSHAIALQREGRQVKFLFLPDGEDPDSLVRQEGPEAFKVRLSEQSLPLSTYLFEELGRQTDISSLDGKARLAALAKPLIGKATDPVFKMLLEQELNQRIGLSQPMIAERPAAPRPSRAPTRPKPLAMTPMRTVLALLLQQPTLIDELPVNAERELKALKGGELLALMAQTLREQPGVNTGVLLGLFADHPHEDTLRQLAAWAPDGADTDPKLLETFEASRPQVFADALTRLRHEAAQAAADPAHLEARVRSGLATAEEKARFMAGLRAGKT
ncbi:DNA primase [Permianibacter sp. IMCC34836]|uniref:DNA primase n=1 Tax=Permianibacter fluminis TaxID=2738515 RepID=UPI0015557D15|nr:DNA primase [Permianibacter fluminis]NQD36398.1 DNA primase [Permianibacter fluminis]